MAKMTGRTGMSDSVDDMISADAADATAADVTAAETAYEAQNLERLRDAGLRPTRQRLALTGLLFDKGDQHVTAESLHGAARDADIKVSLATIYNSLNQFTDAGLLREVVVAPGKSFFDTNMAPHHHFFMERTGELIDIPLESVALSAMPDAPEGTKIERVDVVIRLANA